MLATAEIVTARSPAEYAAARDLFETYAQELDVDLCFQNFAFELDHLHEMYATPTGCLLLARSGDDLVGCVGVRRFSNDVCEMKRLYVKNHVRGHGVGRNLALRAISTGTALGYARMLLDTLPGMAEALQLYTSLGFRETTAYYDNPNPCVKYLVLDLVRVG